MATSTEQRGSAQRKCFGACDPVNGDKSFKIDFEQTDNAKLSQELNELSVQEREKIYDEIHGVNPTLQETPEMAEESLKKLKKALSEMSRLKRKNYDRAVFLRPGLENDTQFQLMFLRADRHEPTLAARRMCQYFTDKLDLFGDEKLVKEITLEDMDEDDMKTLDGGAVQILKHKDQSGRPVLLTAFKFNHFKHWKNAIRQTWYQMMVMLEEEEAQINGVVNVLYCVDIDSTETLCPTMTTRGGPMLANLPFRSNCVHFCYNHSRIHPIMELFKILVGKQMRLRFRIHFGSHQEVMYALMSFGISMADFPIHIGGTLNVDNNHKFLEKRKAIEAARKAEIEASGIVFYPNQGDVLLGRGRPFQRYSGNQSLAILIDGHRQRYSQANARSEKGPICSELVFAIQSSGGRFLQRSKDRWTPVSLDVARAKVSHGFRTKTNRHAQDMDDTASLVLMANNNNDNPPDSSDTLVQEGSKRARYDDQPFAEWNSNEE